jgi:hypothetical protein
VEDAMTVFGDSRWGRGWRYPGSSKKTTRLRGDFAREEVMPLLQAAAPALRNQGAEEERERLREALMPGEKSMLAWRGRKLLIGPETFERIFAELDTPAPSKSPTASAFRYALEAIAGNSNDPSAVDEARKVLSLFPAPSEPEEAK